MKKLFSVLTTINTLKQKWTKQQGEFRFLQEQAFDEKQVKLRENAVELTIDKYPTGVNLNAYGYPIVNGNNRNAPYKSGEIATKRNFLYGYIEGKIKLPGGSGSFPGLQLNLSGKTAGSYFVSIEADDEKIVKKLILR